MAFPFLTDGTMPLLAYIEGHGDPSIVGYDPTGFVLSAVDQKGFVQWTDPATEAFGIWDQTGTSAFLRTAKDIDMQDFRLKNVEAITSGISLSSTNNYIETRDQIGSTLDPEEDLIVSARNYLHLISNAGAIDANSGDILLEAASDITHQAAGTIFLTSGDDRVDFNGHTLTQIGFLTNTTDTTPDSGDPYISFGGNNVVLHAPINEQVQFYINGVLEAYISAGELFLDDIHLNLDNHYIWNAQGLELNAVSTAIGEATASAADGAIFVDQGDDHLYYHHNTVGTKRVIFEISDLSITPMVPSTDYIAFADTSDGGDHKATLFSDALSAAGVGSMDDFDVTGDTGATGTISDGDELEFDGINGLTANVSTSAGKVTVTLNPGGPYDNYGSWTIAGDTGSETISSGETVTIVGGTNITTSWDSGANELTINGASGTVSQWDDNAGNGWIEQSNPARDVYIQGASLLGVAEIAQGTTLSSSTSWFDLIASTYGIAMNMGSASGDGQTTELFLGWSSVAQLTIRYNVTDDEVWIEDETGAEVWVDHNGGDHVNESDSTLKKNVASQNIDESLTLVNALRPVTFQWDKTHPLRARHDDTVTHCGFIAQEFQQQLPTSVVSVTKKHLPDGTKPTLDTDPETLDETTVLALGTKELIPHLVGAIKALTDRVAALEGA